MAVNRTDETAYVIFKNNKMIYTDIGKSTTDIQEQKYNNTMASSQVKITTNIPDDTIVFSPQGFPIDKSGNVLKNLHIYIEKENEEIRTINISCMGNIDIVNGKDTSEDDICDLTTFTADVKDVLLCKDNEEFFQGVCVEKCKDKYLRNMAGECILQCPSDEKVEGDKCVKRCPDVKKIWDAFLGECRDFCNYEEEDLFDGSCLKKCTGGMERQEDGTCACPSGQHEEDGICVEDVKEPEKDPQINIGVRSFRDGGNNRFDGGFGVQGGRDYYEYGGGFGFGKAIFNQDVFVQNGRCEGTVGGGGITSNATEASNLNFVHTISRTPTYYSSFLLPQGQTLYMFAETTVGGSSVDIAICQASIYRKKNAKTPLTYELYITTGTKRWYKF